MDMVVQQLMFSSSSDHLEDGEKAPPSTRLFEMTSAVRCAHFREYGELPEHLRGLSLFALGERVHFLSSVFNSCSAELCCILKMFSCTCERST